MVRARGPDFLTVDDPLATIEVGSCDGAGKVGTAARLAKQLAPCIFAREDAPQVPRLLAIVTVLENRRGCQQTDTATGHGDSVYTGEFLLHDRIQNQGQVLPKPLRWPRGHSPTGFGKFGAPFD